METNASSSSLAKGKGKGKSKKGGNSGRGRGRTMPQPMQGTQQSDHQGYGYMNPEWEPHYQPPWRPDPQAPYMQDLNYQVNTMSRLLIRHEMELMALRADTGFVMQSRSGDTGHHSAGLSGEQGVSRSEVSAASYATNFKADHAHDSVPHSSRSARSVGYGGQEGPAAGASEARLVSPDRRSMVLSQVVGGEGELGSRGAAKDEPTCSFEGPSQQHPGEPRGKPHLVPVQHNQAPHRTDGSDAAILHQGLPTRRKGPGSLSTASSSVRPRMPPDDRHDSAAGKTRASEVIATASAGDEAVVTSSTHRRLPSQLDCNSTVTRSGLETVESRLQQLLCQLLTAEPPVE